MSTSPDAAVGAVAETPAVSVVVVSYNMGRELPRTVRSLSPPLQAPVSGGCEVIVVDNGSNRPPLQDDFGPLDPPCRILRVPAPTPSPVAAVNLGLSSARGAIVGVLIDGARMATPGLVAACQAVCDRVPRAVAATLNYHLGHAPQYRPEARGYSRKDEDALLDSIGWPADGYRLFEIGRPADLSGIDGPMLESNALFMHRTMWRELGGYDPAFASPGGGAVNPDTCRRAVELPGAVLVKVAGEATFHQIHGGVTSNAADAGEVLQAIGRDYWRIRQRPLGAIRVPALVYDSKTGDLGAEADLRARLRR